jgi:hypothetical protein
MITFKTYVGWYANRINPATKRAWTRDEIIADGIDERIVDIYLPVVKNLNDFMLATILRVATDDELLTRWQAEHGDVYPVFPPGFPVLWIPVGTAAATEGATDEIGKMKSDTYWQQLRAIVGK